MKVYSDEVMQHIHDFQEHRETDHEVVVDDLISFRIGEFSALNYAYSKMEYRYECLKNKYEIGLIRKKYSKEYEKYKTIKEKEERAKLELNEEKKELISLKEQLHLLRANIEATEKELKYAFIMYGGHKCQTM